MSYTRFALYYVPPEGVLADFGAAWLGWDVVRGRAADQLSVTGLDDVTMTPRKYGFHGTLKPPFRLAEGCTDIELERAVTDMAARCAPASCAGLELTALGRFLALTPTGDTSDLARVAATCVQELDRFRAAPSEAELERRRKANLSTRQEELLAAWGYPYVMDQFRFHLTLTGRVAKADVAHWMETVRAHLPELPAPFIFTEVALCGEREDGRFELLHRYALTG